MYSSIALIERDGHVRDRLAACLAVESPGVYPAQWVQDHSWFFATRPGWAEAWEASDAAEPGADEAAITDAMILAAVREVLDGEVS
jgi:hypothetical protein